METTSTRLNGDTWRELYLAALFESAAALLTIRIAEAEKALVLRARELFRTTGDQIEEEHALDDAMYALRALRNTYRCVNPLAQSRAETA